MNTFFQIRNRLGLVFLLFGVALLGCGDSKPIVTKMPPAKRPTGPPQTQGGPRGASPRKKAPRNPGQSGAGASGRRPVGNAVSFGGGSAFPVTYMESKGFYQLFNETMQVKMSMQVHFDGDSKLSANSPVLRAVAKLRAL